MLNAWSLGSFLIGYLLGSLPFGYLVARAHGVDICKAGSGNPGATNVKRVLGARAGYTVFALDALKGAVAAGWPRFIRYRETMLAFDTGKTTTLVDTMQIWHQLALLGLIGAVLGHSFSVFTKFKGGKGVATAAGGVLVIMPVSCLIGGAVWIVTFYATRYVSLGSILAAVAVPTSSWLRGNPLPLNIAATAVGLFVIVRHRENISRLLKGTESKFAKKPPTQP